MGSVMTLEEYETRATFFAEYKSRSYPYFGLMEEVGELMGILAKAHRGDNLVERYGSEDGVEDRILGELGDVLWMLTAVAADLGFSLQEVAEENLEKLQDRADRGVIKGSGDKR